MKALTKIAVAIIDVAMWFNFYERID